MRILITSFFIFQIFLANAQKVKTSYINEQALKAEIFIGADTFENLYYVIDNTLFKKTKQKTYNYRNTQFGEISSVDIANPLKVLVFYQDFNTIVILDNRLNELTDAINFGIESFSKNIANVTIASNNNLWLYSLDDNVLSLWNYETKQTLFNTQPLSFFENDFEATSQISTYEYCWLVSNKSVLQFNEFGSFINSFEIQQPIKKIIPFLEGYIYLTEKKLFYNDGIGSNEVIMSIYKHSLDNFTITKNNLYFFDANVLHKYILLKK